MRKLAVAAVVLMVIGIGAQAARADDKKEIEALYGRLRQAILTSRPEATLAMETPDFKATGADGKSVDGKQLAAQMKQQFAMGKTTAMDIKIASMSVKGKMANVTTHFTSSVAIKDQQGNTHVMGMSGSIHNTLAKTAQGWKFKSMDEKPGKITVDGKPLNGAMAISGPARKK